MEFILVMSFYVLRSKNNIKTQNKDESSIEAVQKEVKKKEISKSIIFTLLIK